MSQLLLALMMLANFSCGQNFQPPTAASNAAQNQEWRAATYRGLTVGTSTRADMLRLLGKPIYSGPMVDQEEPEPIIWNGYGKTTGELSGELAVIVDSRTDLIISISISPDNRSQEAAIRYFGNDYRRTGYDFCPDSPDDAEVWPIYEKPHGSQINYIEYRSRGIAIHLDYTGKINTIDFVYAPVGLASKDDCKKESEKYKSKAPKS